jgi:two-component system phosphate regulon sensor histidine kinase PhoR
LKKKWYENVVWLFFCIIVIGCSFGASYFLTSLLYKVTGQPSELWRQIISGFLGFGIIFLLIWRKIPKQNQLTENIFEALEKISRGNFEAFVTKDKHGYFDELVDKINNMAKELGGVEQMRQDFISNVSHEFQSPLTSIGGYATLLRNEGATLQQIEYAIIIEEESKRLSKLADNLLMLSALETKDVPIVKDSYQLDRQIENVLLLLEPQWSVKSIMPEASLPKTIFYGNENLLKQVWINLLVNAIKFTSENGEISVSITSDNENVECVISDNGIGIAPSNVVHIFERFYKVDKSRDRSLGGNGLGLSLVRKIVDLHGGNIMVESTLGKGTAFTVILPIKEQTN